MKNVTIIGATGFGGLGLIEILLRHPDFAIKQLIARKDTGIPISDVFPHLKGHCDLVVESPENIEYSGIDLAFFSTPDRAGMTMINDYYEKGIRVIDYSGDFRFHTTEDYGIYARNKGMEDKHLAPEIMNESVYGLPEKNAEQIKDAKVVGNPGCYAIGMILGLLPAIEAGIINSSTIIIDGKTGVSGAGKNSGEANLYPQRHENVNTYREGHHQHLVEVENIINEVGSSKKNILFIPHLVPINRGILNTIYADVQEGYTTDKLQALYRDYYKDKPFVLVTDKSPHTAQVRGSNRCVVRPAIDPRTGKLFIVSVIDNLLKGQSGNAVQNANIMMGFEETRGIDVPAFYP
ncbi:MAG: N-acetyl-gamma-glutamyl-phosphate reductase [bacterium]|nr:N-acetyl-gamma-glutamyl-phosphate reductase [bacterium]